MLFASFAPDRKSVLLARKPLMLVGVAGDTIRGWKVAEISEQNAVLLAYGLRGELQLFAARAAKVR